MGCLLPWFPHSVQTPLSQEHTLFADSLGLEWKKFKIHEWGLYKLCSINKLILTNFMVKCMYTTFACFLINHKTEKLVNELEFVHPFAAITLTRSPVTMQFDFFQNSDLIWVQESRLFYTSSIRDLTVTLTIKVLRTSHGHTNWKLHDTQHVTLSHMSRWQWRGYDVTLW